MAWDEDISVLDLERFSRMHDAFRATVRGAQLVRARANEELVRSLLGRWVSEIPPALAVDQNGCIVGLTPEDTPVGVKGFILGWKE